MVSAWPGDVMVANVQEVGRDKWGDEGKEKVSLDVSRAHPPP